MFFVYVLKSLKDGKLYTGQTSNLQERVTWHNSGKQKSTKFRLPVTLVYSEPYATRNEAMKREKELKTGKGRDLLKKILK
ncbi:MAG: GIY-YIG nuclease family protein [Elusimicrobiota bacterium]